MRCKPLSSNSPVKCNITMKYVFTMTLFHCIPTAISCEIPDQISRVRGWKTIKKDKKAQKDDSKNKENALKSDNTKKKSPLTTNLHAKDMKNSASESMKSRGDKKTSQDLPIHKSSSANTLTGKTSDSQESLHLKSNEWSIKKSSKSTKNPGPKNRNNPEKSGKIQKIRICGTMLLSPLLMFTPRACICTVSH